MARILILWNQVDTDVTTLWRRDGRKTTDWDPAKVVDPGDTVEEEMDLLEASVREAGHEVVVANIRDDYERMLDIIDRVKPDAVMNLIEFFHDDIAHEFHVASTYELLHVPYTGARPLALALCQNKPHAKAILAASGLPTPKWIGVQPGHKVPRHLTLRFPMIVKPAFEDASGGIDANSIVRTRAELTARVEHVHTEHRMMALVEEFIEGREIHAAVLGNPFRALPLFEMEFKDAPDDEGNLLPHIITYRAKWDPFSRDYYAVESRCPADGLEVDQIAQIQDVAMRACALLGVRDYARVDMRLDATTKQPYILEVNPNPDLASGCAFAQAVRASGRTYQQAIAEIVECALARGRSAMLPPTSNDMLLREYLSKKHTAK